MTDFDLANEAVRSHLTRLLNEAAEGDDEALNVAYEEIVVRLTTIARDAKKKFPAGVAVDTTELVDDALMRTLNAKKTPFFSSRDDFFRFLCVVIYNLLRDATRRATRRLEIPIHSIQQLEHKLADGEQRDLPYLEWVLDAIDQIDRSSPEAAQLFKRHVLCEQSIEEAAEDLGIEPSEAAKLFSLVRAKVKLHVQTQQDRARDKA